MNYNKELETNREAKKQYDTVQKKLASERLAKVRDLKRMRKKEK